MSGHVGPGGGMMASQPVNESLQICVPNSAVGAIIGAGGANIKQIMRESGAFVNVSVVIVVLGLPSLLCDVIAVSLRQFSSSGPTFSKLLRKIFERFLSLGNL